MAKNEKIEIKSSKQDVQKFLDEMKSVLDKEDFNIETDFVFQETRKNDDPDDECTNENTMIALGYDTEDVIEELKSLTVKNYSESIVDSKPKKAIRIFYVFGKMIQGREVYIKVRMKEHPNNGKYVFCLSFHFSKKPMNYLY